MRRFTALTVLGTGLLLFGTLGTSLGLASDPISGIGEPRQSIRELGVASMLLDVGFERSLELPAMQKSDPSPSYGSVRARS